MRFISASCAFTIAALLGLGLGVDSIQWFMSISGPAVPPRFGRFENSDGSWNVYGVSWSTWNAGWYQATPAELFSAITTTRWSVSTISRSVGHGGVTGPR